MSGSSEHAYDVDPPFDDVTEPGEATVASPRSARNAAPAADPATGDPDSTVAIPGPLRRGQGTAPDDGGPPTSDTIAAHRAHRRRSQQSPTTAEVSLPAERDAPAVDLAPGGEGFGRTAYVPDPSNPASYPARSVAPVIAARGSRPMSTPQPLRDGAAIDRAIRGTARRRAAGVGAVIVGGVLIAAGLLAIALFAFLP